MNPGTLGVSLWSGGDCAGPVPRGARAALKQKSGLARDRRLRTDSAGILGLQSEEDVKLNPSTADETDNDPTVERCQRRSLAMGYGGLVVCNIFAYRSTDPSALYTEADPIGPSNDQAILEQAALAGRVVCGWGKHGALHDRGAQVLALLRKNGITPYALQINGDGSPKHPLYVGYHHAPAPMPGTGPATDHAT